MENLPIVMQELVASFSALLGGPSGRSFATLVIGWILCNGRHTLTGAIRAAGPMATKSHDAYQNFFSKSKWSMDTFWKALFLTLVKVFVHAGGRGKKKVCKPICLAGDDTLVKHSGHKIWGSGLYRDAVRSSKRHTAFAWGLNWVLLAMIVKVRFLRDHYIALPILARLNEKTPPNSEHPVARRKNKGRESKNKKTTVSIMGEMLHTVAGWLPEGNFLLCGDGAYACLAGHLPDNISLVSRIRCDAALFAPPAKRRNHHTAGRPAKKGRRLLTPQRMADSVGNHRQKLTITLYGQSVVRLLYSYTALWYDVCSDHPFRIVIVRDPSGSNHDEFFFSTNTNFSQEQIVMTYSTRWPIEVVFRECKQYLGIHEPQARTQLAVSRISPFCLWINAIVKLAFIQQSPVTLPLLPNNDPWYPHKSDFSFQDMLSSIRLHFWSNFIFGQVNFT